MFIIWGKKRVRRRLGRVAEFCPICRDIRPHKVMRIGMASHIYYISVGEGQLTGFELHCEDCAGCRILQEAPYPHIARDKKLDLKELLVQTNPRLTERMQERLQLERGLQSTRLTAEKRHELLLEPFVQLSPWVETRVAESRIDWICGLSVLGALALFIAWIATHDSRWGKSNLASNTMGWLAAVLVVFVLVRMATDGPRFVRRRVIPLMARALRPLRPSFDELERTIEFLRARRLKIGKHIRPAALERQLKLDGETVEHSGNRRLA